MLNNDDRAKSKKSVSESMIFDAVQYIHLSWLKSNECLNVHCLNYIRRLSTSKVTKNKFIWDPVYQEIGIDIMSIDYFMSPTTTCGSGAVICSAADQGILSQEQGNTRPTGFNNERMRWQETHACTGRQKNIRVHLNSIVSL